MHLVFFKKHKQRDFCQLKKQKCCFQIQQQKKNQNKKKSMPLQSGIVAANGVILTQDKPLSPIMKQTLQKLIENLPKHDSKVSYQISGSTYHCLVENTIVYIVVSDADTQARTAYGMLAEAKEAFKQQFGNGGYPKPADLNAARCGKFSSTLAQKIRYFNDNPQGDKIGKLKNQIEDVKNVMLNNIDEIMERGQRIDNLVDKSEVLLEQADHFEDNARTLKNVMICRQIKIVLAVVFALGILGLIIAMIACKPNFEKCKSADPAPAPAAPAGTNTTAAAAQFQLYNNKIKQ
jgi:vesicle-associated membrane protein 7